MTFRPRNPAISKAALLDPKSPMGKSWDGAERLGPLLLLCAAHTPVFRGSAVCAAKRKGMMSTRMMRLGEPISVRENVSQASIASDDISEYLAGLLNSIGLLGCRKQS